MKKIQLQTGCKKLLADVFTPVGIYLRLRDRFRDTVLLESTDNHAADNSFSFIGINAIGGIEITSTQSIEFKLPGQQPEKITVKNTHEVPQLIWDFMQRFEIHSTEKEAKYAQGLFGYTSFDAVQFFDTIALKSGSLAPGIPLMRYRLYQYVIAINHYKDELYICENTIPGLESELSVVESLIKSKDVPVYPFKAKGAETSNMTNEEYVEMVKKGISSCHRGDVFQIVLSRRFEQSFIGDEFNVYRALRSINPSFKRTGDDEIDQREAARLLLDAKENAEHVMLVDLARNDLSRLCDDVKVEHYRQVQYYSHVIHLVSEVTGKVRPGTNPFELLAKTFPAGTLSGAPKIKAMQLIDAYEPGPRNNYGGAIGFMGFDGSCIHAIMIRTFLSMHNTLFYQAGAGIVAASKPENELQEVNNKLGALKKAIGFAENI
jgi:anthranilate synthase component 1